MWKYAAIVVALIVLVIGLQEYNEPRTYEDCVIKNVSGVESDQAARSVAAACRKKFPIQGEYDDIFGVTSK